jgi:hypothetical protein
MGDTITPSAVLTDQAKALNDKFYLLLNEMVKNYPAAKLNPASSSKEDVTKSNEVIYGSYMKQMLQLQNDYFLFKNNVVASSETILKMVAASHEHINAIESQNKVLKLQYDNLKTSSYSAEGLFDDAQITRNQLLFSNFILFGVMCGGGFLYYKSIASAAT